MTTRPADTPAPATGGFPAETMPRAPRLPPILHTPVEPMAEPQPVAAATPLLATPLLASRVLAAVAEQHRRTTELHLAFLHQQTRLYELVAAGPQAARAADVGVTEEVLDPAAAPWVLDHRPNWTVPVLPMMSIVDHLARAAAHHTGRPVSAVRDMRLRRWLPVPGPVRVRTTVTGPPECPSVTLAVWWEARTPALSRFVDITTAQIETGPPATEPPTRFAALADPRPVADLYQSSELFHGPAFQYLVSLHTDGAGVGATGTLDAGRGTVPPGLLHPGLLDAATHSIPHADLWQRARAGDPDLLGFPHRIAWLRAFEPLPHSGRIEAETRFAGFDDEDPALPAFDVQLCERTRVLLDFRLVVMLLPAGRVARVAPQLRRAYLRDRRYVPELLLSTSADSVTTVRREDVEAFDAPPGTVAAVYGLPPGAPGREHVGRIAAKEHLARRLNVHPGLVEVDDDLRTARIAADPSNSVALDIHRDHDRASATDHQPGETP